MEKTTQTGAFDRAFCEVVEKLNSTRRDHNNFKTKAELLNLLHISPPNYNKIKTGTRSVPREKMQAIVEYFFYNYNVRREFLRNHTGPMFHTDNFQVSDYGTTYATSQDRIKELEKENAELKAERDALLSELSKKQG